METTSGVSSPASDFEIAVSGLLASSSSASPAATAYADDVFDKLARYLSQAGKEQWSLRPRTYLVLRLINRLDSMDAFILDGLFDIALPYTYSRLPAALSPGARNAFLEKQRLVMCKAGDLEVESGRHRHFSSTAETNFVVVKQLGSGYFGVVDHVRSKLSLEEYARKRTLRARTFSKDKKALKIFENELSNLKRLSHRHLVKYVGSYTDPAYIGLLISPVADCDLKIFLSQSPFPHNLTSLLRSFLGCLCSALSYLHSQKCRHKDIKPGNILVKNDLVLITDFGTSRNWSDRSKGTTTGDSGPYTPGYAAPEVVAWEARNESSDIWSLGCVYLDILTVLKGETLRTKDQFFADHGNGGRNPRVNPQALQLWLAKLQSSSSDDNQPIVWVQNMLEVGPKDRISSVRLLDEILGYVDDHIYYGLCCSDQEAEVSSCHSSESADDASTDDEHAEDITNATSVVSRGTNSANDAETGMALNIGYHQSDEFQDVKSSESVPPADTSGDSSSLVKRKKLPTSPSPLPTSEPSKTVTRNPFLPGYVPVPYQKTQTLPTDLFQAFFQDQLSTTQASERSIEDETSGNADADRTVPQETALALSQSTIQLANLGTGPMLSSPEPGHADVSKPPKSDIYLLFNAAAENNVSDLLKYGGADSSSSWGIHGRTIFHVAAENGGREAMQALLDLGCPVTDDDVAQYVMPMLYQQELTLNPSKSLHSTVLRQMDMLRNAGRGAYQAQTQPYPSHHLQGDEHAATATGFKPTPRYLSVWDPAAQHYNLTVRPDPLAVHKAILAGDHDQLRLCLAGGCDAEIRDDNNYSPLDMAINIGSFLMVKLLLQYGANPVRKNHYGQDAYSQMVSHFSREDCNELMATRREYQPSGETSMPYPMVHHGSWSDFLARVLSGSQDADDLAKLARQQYRRELELRNRQHVNDMNYTAPGHFPMAELEDTSGSYQYYTPPVTYRPSTGTVYGGDPPHPPARPKGILGKWLRKN